MDEYYEDIGNKIVIGITYLFVAGCLTLGIYGDYNKYKLRKEERELTKIEQNVKEYGTKDYCNKFRKEISLEDCFKESDAKMVRLKEVRKIIEQIEEYEREDQESEHYEFFYP